MKRWLHSHPKAVLGSTLVLVLVIGAFFAVRGFDRMTRNTVVAYFENSSDLFAGDDVRIRGVSVGKIEKVEPQPLRAKVTFWFDRKYKVPADAIAVMLSPQLVTGRTIQLTPPYKNGPTMADGAVIPQDRTVVPVEWDQVRDQLVRLTEMLQPTKPGGVSTLGALVNTASDNLRGQGGTIRETIIKLAQAVSVLDDHRNDVFGTIRNLSTLVSALRDSSGLLGQLNTNLAAVSSVLANNPNKVGQAVQDLNAVVADVQSFAAENREPVGTTADKLASISNAVMESLYDIKQFLHSSPTPLVNLYNIYEPANGNLTGALQINNFADPIQFVCGSIQAASRLGAGQAAKLCMQYLAPIFKNRMYNFLPLGENLFVGPNARPNEVFYSEDWMRPNFVPPAPSSPAAGVPAAPGEAPPASETVAADPAAGLTGMMVPPGGAQ